MKGHARIELTDAQTGVRKVIEHDNMVTNAVADMCTSYCGDMAAIMKITTNGETYAKNLFGGLLLFADQLDGTEDDYYIPSVNITGYASSEAYAGTDTARGNYNEVESGVQDDGSYKWVWDFSTSQGNGTISSLALCPNVMGQIGASDLATGSEDFRKVKAPTTPFNTNGYMRPGYYNASIVALDGDIAYCAYIPNVSYNSNTSAEYIKNNGGILMLLKYKLGFSSISLSDQVGVAKFIEDVNVQLPTELTGALGTSGYGLDFRFEPGKLIVSFNFEADIANNGTRKYCIVNLADMSVTTKTFTNTCGKTIVYAGSATWGSTATDAARTRIYYSSDYIVYFAGWTTSTQAHNVYVASAADCTDVKTVHTADGTPLTIAASGNKDGCMAPLYRMGDILAVTFTSSTDTGFTDAASIYLLDLTTGLVKKTNAKVISNDGRCVNIGNKVVWAQTGPYVKFKQTVCPFILTTKNNLDEPVVKTASQTMKITYTLTESEAK